MSSLNTLNQALHSQLKVIGNTQLSGEKLDEELNRADKMVSISRELIGVADKTSGACVRERSERIAVTPFVMCF